MRVVVRSERGRRRDRLDRFLIFGDGDGECSIVHFLGVVLVFAVAAESMQVLWSFSTVASVLLSALVLRINNTVVS